MEQLVFGFAGFLSIVVMIGIIGAGIWFMVDYLVNIYILKVGDLVYVNTPREISNGTGVIVKIEGIMYTVLYDDNTDNECLESELRKIK